MRGAPNFVKWPDSVDGKWKQDLLVWLAQQVGARVLVETGTCEGATPLAIHQHFDTIHTVELHDGLFETAKRWIGNLDNVEMYHASSVDALPIILKRLPEGPVIFWLDAHSSGPHTADAGNVLPEEIRLITTAKKNAVIVIDDQISADSVAYMIPDGWHCEYRTGEVLVYRKELFQIPEFEN